MKRFVVNLSNAETMKKSYASPNSIVINIDAESLLAGTTPQHGVGGDDGEGDDSDDIFAHSEE